VVQGTAFIVDFPLLETKGSWRALSFAHLPDRPYRCGLSPQGSGGFYVRAEHASLPPHPSDMLTT
jgi:hypothetical protein